MVNSARLASIALLAGCVACATGPRRIPEADYPREGQALAQRACTPCHAVSRDQATRPIPDRHTPGFAEIAQAPGTTAESLRRFLRTTHAATSGPLRMPSPMLDEGQMTLIVSYILSLRGQDRPG
ncbi:c-type cytochrome [Roseicella aquatilis]|uniref:C-type cytochrome n=1 Tax=Roseicella aquatilis TaxID=2527868 RepID=A0A4R4DRL7_9PROT|nr:c-type cytochrome [Roseicella aquatilis]TCZ64018.1 c-type cytochrome [Roseicella aquatilis]